MQLLNKSKRSFHVSIGQIKPEEVFCVPDEEGKKLLVLYGSNDEIVELEVEPEPQPQTKTKTKTK